MSVRVRFAPSPTGPLHLGNARTAVVNWLFSQKEGGVFILRIEDTDEKRFDPSAESLIIKELLWLSIRPGEGPGLGGKLGPYRQGERHEIYRDAAERLLSEGHAYRCYCTEEMLEQERREAAARGRPPRYSGRCRSLTSRDIAARRDAPFTVRFRADFTDIRIDDLIHGQIAFPSEAFGDFVIMRADGSPMFIFCSAVDDALMGITHVIRGEDHLPNTPRQILVYRALGATLPAFAHLPLLLNESGEKIKKREGGHNLEDLICQGYVPEGVFAYLAGLGNPAVTGKHILPIDRVIADFDIRRLGRAGVKFSPEKLRHTGTLATRQLDPEDLAGRLMPIIEAQKYPPELFTKTAVIGFARLVRDNISNLAEAAQFAPIFFTELPPQTEWSEKVLATDGAKVVLSALIEQIDGVSSLSAEAYRNIVTAVSQKTGRSGKDLFMPIRAAITGMEHGPALEGIVEEIGIDRTRRRVRRALELPSS